MEIEFRLATKEDTESLMKMEYELFKKWDSMDPIDKIDHSWFMSEDHKARVLKFLEDSGKRYFVAVIGGKVVGFLMAEIVTREPFLKKVGYVSEAFIYQEYRGKKLGTGMLEMSISWFREKNLQWTTVSTHSLDEEANPFWERRGYREFNKFFKMRL